MLYDEETIQHVGVKGMHWGVRRNLSKSQNGDTKAKKPSRIKEELNSLSRERQWKKVLKNANGMTTKQINTTVNRIQMENDLKKLSKKLKVGSSKDKQDYRNRANMSNQELMRKVGRLRAKDNLARVVSDASKSQSILGERIVKTAGPLAVKYALTGKIGRKDVINVISNPNLASNKTKNDLVNATWDKVKQSKD